MKKFFSSDSRTSEPAIDNTPLHYSDTFSRGNTFSSMSHNYFSSSKKTIKITNSNVYSIPIEL